MGILDEAIREHLELKRQHGADDSELKQLEDEAFGQAERPGSEPAHDPLAEAPTEFLTQPETTEAPGARREPPTIADLQEPPPPPAETAGLPEVETPLADEPPSEEEQPAMEHEIVADAPEAEEAPSEPEPDIEPAGPSTEERQAIAEQPTELFDVEEELEDPPQPSDEEIVEEEIAEPRLAPTDPLAGLQEGEEAEVTVEGPAPDDDDEYDEEDDAFWNEQRLSDELDQALEAPRELEPDYEDEPEPEPVADEDVEDEPEPASEPEPADEPAAEADAPRREEDLLEETPDFLEEAPEDDQLWFEQKPPKDFDFDD
jgi:hypothetical protein